MVVTLPTTTRAAVYHGEGDIRIERVPIGSPGPGEALVRIRLCGLCSSETMAWYMARKAPVPLGHEPVGEVVAVGGGVTLATGTRVFVHHHAPCGRCRFCLRGDVVHCATWRRTRLHPGGLSEFAMVSSEILAGDVLPLPEDLSDEAAVFVEPLATIVKAQRRVGLQPEDRVVVIGLGVTGLLHLRLARRRGVQRVVGVDPLPERRESARASGADAVLDASGPEAAAAVKAATEGGADVVIVTPTSLEALRLGFGSVAAGGRLLVFAPLSSETLWPLPVHDLFFQEVTVIPSYSAGPRDTREALHWLTSGLPVEDLITHRLSLDQAAEGYRLVLSGRALKVVVRP